MNSQYVLPELLFQDSVPPPAPGWFPVLQVPAPWCPTPTRSLTQVQCYLCEQEEMGLKTRTDPGSMLLRPIEALEVTQFQQVFKQWPSRAVLNQWVMAPLESRIRYPADPTFTLQIIAVAKL